jgi:hypothetical protein
MMKTSLLLILLLSLQVASFAQQWGKNTLSSYANEALDIEADAAGNYYVAGYLTGETDFSQGMTVSNISGNGDIYVAKYASDGAFVWVRKFGGSNSDRAVDLAVGPDQDIVVTGQYSGTVTFGVTTLTSAFGSKDIFLLKLGPDGEAIWARSEGGSMAENAYGVTVDHSGNVVLTGQFQGSAQIGGQSFTSVPDMETGSPSFDIFISKYTSGGAPLWVRTGQASYEDRGLAVATDAQDNIFLTGQFSDTLVFASQTFPNVSFNTGFLAKLNPAGQVLFINRLRASAVTANDVEINSLGEVIVTGDYLGTLSYYDAAGQHSAQNAYDRKIFVLKTANNGGFSWIRSKGSDDFVTSRSVSCDAANSIYITGDFKCGFSELREENEAIFNSEGFKDPYIMKLSPGGEFVFARQLGGQWQDEAHGVAVRNADPPVICGSHSLSLNVPVDFAQPVLQGGQYGYSYASGPLALWGDSTRNSFLVSGITASVPDYTYYNISTTDSLVGDIGQDTIVGCEWAQLAYDALSSTTAGPTYSYLWNNGETTLGVYTDQSGWLEVQVDRHDGCASDRDSVFVVVNPNPELPLMSDDHEIAMNSAGSYYAGYFFCEADTVTTWFTGLQPGVQLTVTSPNGQAHNSAAPTAYWNEGSYGVQVESSAHCLASGYFVIDIADSIAFDTLQPALVLEGYLAGTDTITICYAQEIVFRVIDLDNGSGVADSFPFFPLYGANWTISGPQTGAYQANYHLSISPEQTGLYQIGYTGISGMDNGCTTETLSDSASAQVYIIVNPLPQETVTITGPDLLCPGDSLHLTIATGGGATGTWSGPDISPEEQFSPEIYASTEGYYSYTLHVTDPLTGCSNDVFDWHVVQMKTLADLITDPADLLLCPGQTATITAESGFADYEWIGPEGDIADNDNAIQVEEAGAYYCHVTDDDGCLLTAPPVLLNEYSTPYISYEPSLTLCGDGNITLTVLYDGYAEFIWQSPVSSSSPAITVNEPGVYSCIIQQCGQTVTESVTVTDGSFEALITASDLLLCAGETSLLTASDDYALYEWSNGSGEPVINVSGPGSYSLTATNIYGCTSQSNTITIPAVEGSAMPSVEDVSVCQGTDALLTDNGPGVTHWYDLNHAEIGSGNTFHLDDIYVETWVLAGYTAGDCIANDTVRISVVNCGDEMPNVITANNDGANDALLIDEAAANDCGELTIFDRWGGVVYRASPYRNDFNGGELGAGIYFYTWQQCNGGHEGALKQQFLQIVR